MRCLCGQGMAGTDLEDGRVRWVCECGLIRVRERQEVQQAHLAEVRQVLDEANPPRAEKEDERR